MNNQPSNDTVPPHPFFEAVSDPASFKDCINAIDRAGAVIELCNALKLEEEDAGLSPDAAYGFYWITVLARSALSYVSTRMVALSREDEERYGQASAHLSALFSSLPTLGHEHRERLLNQTAAQMNTSRSEVDQFVERMTSL